MFVLRYVVRLEEREECGMKHEGITNLVWLSKPPKALPGGAGHVSSNHQCSPSIVQLKENFYHCVLKF